MLSCQVMQFTGDRTLSPHLVQRTGPIKYLHCVAPGTGPHPTSAGDRTPSPLPGTHDDDEDGTDDDDSCVRSLLGPVKHSAAARIIPGMCVCKRLYTFNMCKGRQVFFSCWDQRRP